MTTLSIVIPAYNEEDGIAEISERVLAAAAGLEKVGVRLLELLVVDDGSSDRTPEIAAAIDGVTLVQHVRNKGYGAALKTGFGQAKGDLIGFLDADGTYPPEYFPALCQVAMQGTELVIGSRMAGAESEMPITRRIGNLFFARLLSIVGRQPVSDSASGMRIFRRESLSRFYPLPDGLNLTPVMSTRAIHEGIKMAEVPIPYSERLGRSKLSVVRDGSVFLHSIIWTALTYNPVRLLGAIGLAGVLIAILSVLGLIVTRASGVTNLVNWQVAALFAGLVAGVAGVSIFSFGVTFNYLVSLFYKKEIRQGLFGRPLFARPLDHQFGWMGAVLLTFGLVVAVASVALGLGGWSSTRLSLYLLLSAMFTLSGLHLCIYWLLFRVLGELNEREVLIEQDLDVADNIAPQTETEIVPALAVTHS